MARKRLGEILIEAGLIDETALRSALIEQRRYGGPLGRVLVDMKLVLEEDLVGALSKQLAVALVDLDALQIPQQVLDIIPADVAEAHGIIPFAQPMKFLDIAMSDPTNLSLVDELRVKTHLNVRTYLAGPKAIERALSRFYGKGIVTRGVPGARRSRDSVELDSLGHERMEMTGAFDQEAAPPPGPSVPRSRTQSSLSGVMRMPGAAVGAPAPPPRPPMGALADPGSQNAPRGPSYADLAALQERVASLEALVRRDEDVLKKLMALLIEKGVATRDEIIARLK
jgi:hypothetical protein